MTKAISMSSVTVTKAKAATEAEVGVEVHKTVVAEVRDAGVATAMEIITKRQRKAMHGHASDRKTREKGEAASKITRISLQGAAPLSPAKSSSKAFRLSTSKHGPARLAQVEAGATSTSPLSLRPPRP